jgi:hypothetical protein
MTECDPTYLSPNTVGNTSSFGTHRFRKKLLATIFSNVNAFGAHSIASAAKRSCNCAWHRGAECSRLKITVSAIPVGQSHAPRPYPSREMELVAMPGFPNPHQRCPVAVGAFCLSPGSDYDCTAARPQSLGHGPKRRYGCARRADRTCRSLGRHLDGVVRQEH